jgi:hypothetical protein
MYNELPYAPADYHICPCCGTEFGNDDAYLTHAQLRATWVANGTPWFFGLRPLGWNPWIQLMQGGHYDAIPLYLAGLSSFTFELPAVTTTEAPVRIAAANNELALAA